MKEKYMVFWILSWSALLSTCGGVTDASRNCEELNPVFRENIAGISNYKSEKRGQKITEAFSVSIPPNVNLDVELFQAGCTEEDLSQEMRIKVYPVDGELLDPPSAPECAYAIGEIMFNLANLEIHSLESLSAWGLAIAKKHRKFSYNEAIYIDDAKRFTATINKVNRQKYVAFTVLIK